MNTFQNLALVILMITFQTISHAAEEPARLNSSYDIQSLDYYPHLGHFEIDPGLSMSIVDQEEDSIKDINNNLLLGGEVGLLIDGLRLGWSFRETLSEVSNNNDSSTNITTASWSHGGHDSLATVKYRYIQNESSGISGDLVVGVWKQITIKAPLRWTTGINQLSISPTFNRYFQQNGDLAYSQGLLPIVDRIHFLDSFYGQLEVDLNAAYTEVNNLNNTHHFPFNVGLVAALGYKCNEHVLIQPSFSYGAYHWTLVDSSGYVSNNLKIQSSVALNMILGF